MSDSPIQGTPEQALAFVRAFVAMQAQMGSVPKEAEGQIGTSRKFKYADFESIVTYCRPFFRDHGFAHLELCGAAEGEATVVSVLVHKDGGLAQSRFSWPAKGHQEIGQGQTYFRRYGLSGLAGLSSGDDTDAEGLQPPQQAHKARQEPTKQQVVANPSPAIEEAQKVFQTIKAFIQGFGKESDQKEWTAAVAKHSQDAHGSVPSILAAKGEVHKLREVMRWAEETLAPPKKAERQPDPEETFYEPERDR